jgi:putative SOS response-associated peptidase YedK
MEELRGLLRPFPAERMRAEAVNRLVNNVRNDNEACIEPIGEPPL